MSEIARDITVSDTLQEFTRAKTLAHNPNLAFRLPSPKLPYMVTPFKGHFLSTRICTPLWLLGGECGRWMDGECGRCMVNVDVVWMVNVDDGR